MIKTNKININNLITWKGNKNRIADKITPLFPKHEVYIELFFGAGGMFFNKQRARYNIVNDINDDIYNLFMILQDANKKDLLYDFIQSCPYSESLFRYWKYNIEEDPIRRAGRFLYLNNYSFLASCQTMSFNISCNRKNNLLKKIELFNNDLCNTKFMNTDFRNVLNSISWKDTDGGDFRNNYKRTFIYADPPYLDTNCNTYKMSNSWKEKDTEDLFLMLYNFQNNNKSGNNHSETIRYAISEFEHPKVLELAYKYNLYVNIIGERLNLNNRRVEVLITNYDTTIENETLF